MLKVPDDLEEHEDSLMSNYDGSIRSAVLRDVVAGNCWAAFPGWDFCGAVWYAEGELHCEVWQHGIHIETVSARDPEQLKIDICNRYGWR